MQGKHDKAIQVCDFDLASETSFISYCMANEVSSINENENESENEVLLNKSLSLSNHIKVLNKELSDQERTMELQNQQIKVLKDSIKDLERKSIFEKAYGNQPGPYSDHLKASICKLITQIPKLTQEGEGLINLIFSLLLLSPNEISEIQRVRSSKSTRSLMCTFNL
jgi:uncharacterized coiled-coil protein SlyX